MKKVFLLCAMALSTFFAKAEVDTNVDYIEKWGRLTLNGIQLSSSKTGEAVQLRGFSSFGNYSENCLKGSADIQRIKGMGANGIRLARYFQGDAGFFSDQDIKDLMKAAKDQGMYCVVDWHLLAEAGGSGNPNAYLEQAKQFFTMVATEVKNNNYEHIIYELSNEPSKGVSAAEIRSYSEKIIEVITAIDQTKPVVIVATPSWDQNIKTLTIDGGQTLGAPYTEKANIMYAFHMYANEPAHKALLNTEFLPATQKIPVFVSEWGTSHAQPEKYQGDKLNDCDETVSSQFLAMCNGEGGSGQKVSWMNWSYGRKPEGSSVFKESSSCMPGDNGANLSKSGRFIVGVLGGSLNPKIVRGAAFSAPYELSSKTVKKELKLKEYDQNPNVEEGTLGGSMDITYYDANNTKEENNDGGLDPDYNPLLKVRVIDGNTKEEREVIQCFAGRVWCTFRDYECVDLTDACMVDEATGKAGWGASTGMSWVSSGEWLNYTFDVKDAGYYSLEMAVGPGNVGHGWSEVDKSTGDLVYHAAASFAMSLVDHASQTFMVDIDKSSETKEVSIEEATKAEGEEFNEFAPFAVPTQDNTAYRLWTPCAYDDNGFMKANHGILFKEPGTHVVRLQFPNGFNDQLASLRFSYAKPWNGEGYPEEVKTAVETAPGDAEGIVIYPTVVENGEFNVVVEGAAQVAVTNMAGAVVYSSNINGNSTINANLAAGVYNVKVVAAGDVKVAKIIVK